MATLVVSVKDKVQFKLVSDLMKALQVKTRVLTDEQEEDFELGSLIMQADRTQKVSRDKVMAKLGRK